MIDFFTATKTGVTVTTGVGSATVAIPNDASARPSRYVRLQASGFCFVKFGDATVVATSNDMYVSPNEAVHVSAPGGYFAYIQDTAAVKLNVTPVEG
jgi:hypothetical protein